MPGSHTANPRTCDQLQHQARRAYKSLFLQQFTSGWVAPPTRLGYVRLWKDAVEKHRAGPADSPLEMAVLVVEQGFL